MPIHLAPILPTPGFATYTKTLKDGSIYLKQQTFLMTYLTPQQKKIAVENPVMHKYAKRLIGGRQQTQTIQPWMFGHKETKATCLWLKNLPPLIATTDLKKQVFSLPTAERQRLHYLPPSPNRWMERSKTFKGIAEAMANQWGME